jgi:hypothetical protein
MVGQILSNNNKSATENFQKKFRSKRGLSRVTARTREELFGYPRTEDCQSAQDRRVARACLVTKIL